MQQDYDLGLAGGFCRACYYTGLSVASTEIYYPDFGDSLANSGTFLIGVHKGTTGDASHVRIQTPPQLPQASPQRAHASL